MNSNKDENQPASRLWLSIECLVLFALVPVLLWLISMQGILFVTLWVIAGAALWVLRRKNNKSLRTLLIKSPAIPSSVKRIMVIRLMVAAVAMLIFTKCYDPVRLFEFPMERTALWAMVMVFYPLLSVFPQEVIYRVFFFERYAPLFPNERTMVIMSGLAFGHGHLMFNNWIAYIMSIVGGWIFSWSYAKTRSFPLVWIEHAVYGCFIFTIGLGWYFYSGAAHMHSLQ